MRSRCACWPNSSRTSDRPDGRADGSGDHRPSVSTTLHRTTLQHALDPLPRHVRSIFIARPAFLLPTLPTHPTLNIRTVILLLSGLFRSVLTRLCHVKHDEIIFILLVRLLQINIRNSLLRFISHLIFRQARDVEEAPQRDFQRERKSSRYSSAHPPLGGVDGHRTDHPRHARALAARVRTNSQHDVSPASIRRRDAQTVKRIRSGRCI